METSITAEDRRPRRGRQWQSLNLKKGYPPRGWEDWQGVRELFQNWRDGQIDPYNGGPRHFDDVEIHEKKGNKEGQLIWTANNKRNAAPRRKVIARKSVGADIKRKPNPAQPAKIVWTPDKDSEKNKLEITNYGVRLPHSVFSIGESTKDDDSGLIGGHGEGMKIGINLLLGLGCTVFYFTKGSAPENKDVGEKWEFFYDDDDRSTVKFLQHKHHRAWEDTTVIVTGLPAEYLCPHFYLFLRPPPINYVLPSVQPLSDVSGYLIVDGPLMNHLFISGIFVAKKPSQLHYGYNIPASPGLLGRDRDVVGDIEGLGEEFYDVWELAFTVKDKTEGSQAMRRYLDLFEKDRDCMDIHSSPEFVTKDIAVLLFQEFRLMHGEDAWFYDEEGNVTAQVHIIQVSLRKKPKSISKKLWTMFRTHELVLTANEKRLRMFKNSKESTEHKVPHALLFLQHSLHLLDCFLDLHPILRTFSCSFRNVPPRVDIDATSVVDLTSQIYVNARNLLPTWVHTHNETCLPFSLLQRLAPVPPEGDDDNLELWKYNKEHFHSLDCDCIANRVAQLIEEELLMEEIASVRYRLADQRRTLATTMPRSLKVTHCIVGNQLAMQLRFDDFSIRGSRDALFRVRVCELSKSEVQRVHNPTEGSIAPETNKSGIHEDVSMEGAELPLNSHSSFPLIMTQTSFDRLQILQCRPGVEYSVQVCRDNDLKSLYSLPQQFRALLCSPQNFTAETQVIGASSARSRLSWDAVSEAEIYIVKVWDAERIVQEISTPDTFLEVTLARAGVLSASVHASSMNGSLSSFEPSTIDLRIAPPKRLLSPVLPTAGVGGPRKKQRLEDQIDDDDFGSDVSEVELLDNEEDEENEGEINVTLQYSNAEVLSRGIRPSRSAPLAFSPAKSIARGPSEPSLTIQGTRVVCGSVIDYTYAHKGRSGNAQKRYIGVVREIGKNSFGPHLGSLWITRFEYLSTYLGFSLGHSEDHTELILHSKERLDSRTQTSEKPKDSPTCHYLKVSGVVSIQLAKFNKVSYTSKSKGALENAFVCRHVSVQRPAESSILSPPNWMVAPDLQAEDTSISRHYMEYLTVADISSKGGAKSLGFQMAGFDSVLSVDNSPSAYSTFSCNFPHAITHNQTPERFLQDFEKGQVHIYDATVVLVSVSLEDTRMVDVDPPGQRNSLVSRIARILKSPYLVIEMMPSILQEQYKDRFNLIVCNLLAEGYNLTWKVLHSHKQGLPHRQARVVLIAAMRGLALPEWPKESLKAPTITDALADLVAVDPRDRSGGISGFSVLDQDRMDIESEYASFLSMRSIGQDVPWVFNHGEGPSIKTGETWTPADWNAPLRKVSGSVGKHWPCLHPERGDAFTVREVARIMSFPDTFRFMGTLEEQYKMVGTSMPPLLARMCAEMIKQSTRKYNKARKVFGLVLGQQ